MFNKYIVWWKYYATPKGTASELISPPPVWRRVGFLYRNHVTPCHYPDPKLGKMVQKALYIERIGLGTPKIPQKPPKTQVPQKSPNPTPRSKIPNPWLKNPNPDSKIPTQPQKSQLMTQKSQPTLKNFKTPNQDSKNPTQDPKSTPNPPKNDPRTPDSKKQPKNPKIHEIPKMTKNSQK